MEKLEQLAGRLAQNCNRLASFEAGMADRDEFLEAASAVGGLTDEFLALTYDEHLPVPRNNEGRPHSAGEPCTVLLVEDEPAHRVPVARMLEIRGYRVLEAANGAAAMALAERYQGPIHLLLTDVILPDLSGRELAERLSLLRPELGQIYMSGYTGEEVLFFGLLGPDMATLQKPVRASDLFGILDRVLELEYA